MPRASYKAFKGLSKAFKRLLNGLLKALLAKAFKTPFQGI
jgi:hypothetical protein